MSTQTQEPETDHIPETVEGGSNSRRYRVSEGKFRLGQGQGDDVQDRLHGRLARIGRYTGVSEHDGKPFDNLEVDLDLNGKTVAFKVKLTTITTANSLMRGLLAAAANELVIVEPWLGKPFEKGPGIGKRPTLMSVYRGVVRDGKVVPGEKLYDDMNVSMGDEGKEELFRALQGHPVYKDRPAPGAKDLEPAWDCVIDAAHKHNWPALNQTTEAAYLALANRVAGMAAVTEQLKAGGSPLAPYVNSAAVPATVWSIIATSIASNPTSVATELQPFVAKAVTL